MSLTFYNRKGSPVAYTEDNRNIFFFNGKPIAYIDEDHVYNYENKHLGYYKDGWIRDNEGYCLLFNEKAKDGPSRYTKDIGPIKDQKQPIPTIKKTIKSHIPYKIIQEWSELSYKEFFNQP